MKDNAFTRMENETKNGKGRRKREKKNESKVLTLKRLTHHVYGLFFVRALHLGNRQLRHAVLLEKCHREAE